MNRIVRERYPVAKLPDDLREGLDPLSEVTVTIDEEEQSERVLSLEEIVAHQRQLSRARVNDEQDEAKGAFSDDPVQRIRDLRAKWDVREEFLDRIRAGGA